eukprot:6485304-Amphidinium_carterae.1
MIESTARNPGFCAQDTSPKLWETKRFETISTFCFLFSLQRFGLVLCVHVLLGLLMYGIQLRPKGYNFGEPKVAPPTLKSSPKQEGQRRQISKEQTST